MNKGYVSADGWIYCPICGNKTRTKIHPDTVVKNFPVYCSKCKNETLINLKDMQVEFLEPDTKVQSQ